MNIKIKCLLLVFALANFATSCNSTAQSNDEVDVGKQSQDVLLQEENVENQKNEEQLSQEEITQEGIKESKDFGIMLKEEDIPEILAIPDAFMVEYGFNSPGAKTKDGRIDAFHVGNYDGNKYSLSARAERRKVRMGKWTTEDWKLYYSLKENAMETITAIAGEMSDKGWEDITCTVDNFPEESIEFYEQCDYFITKEEDTAPLLYVLEGKLYDYRLVIPVIFTKDHPNGKITRLRYDGGRFYSSSGYYADEIFDPYDADMWSMSTAY